LRLVSPDGKQVIAKTRQLTGAHQLEEVKQAIQQALASLGQPIPDYLT
jgi:hypothetical protein